MSAPPGFSEHASGLPELSAAAAAVPIHRMSGGGRVITSQVGGIKKSYSMDDLQILELYGLTENTLAPYIEGFNESFKDEFLKQIHSGNCETKGNSITKKDCWAVSAVIRATILANLAKGNARTLPGMVPEKISNAIPRNVPGAGPIGISPDNEIELPEETREVMNQEDRENLEESNRVAPCVRDEITEPDTEEDMSQSEIDTEIDTLQQNITNAPQETVEIMNTLPEKYKKIGDMIRILAPDLLEEYLELFKINLDDKDKRNIQESVPKTYGSPPTNRTSQPYKDYKERIRNEMNKLLQKKRKNAVDAFLLRSDVVERLQSSSASTRIASMTDIPGADLEFTSVVPTMPLGRGPVAPNNSAYFEENPANFHKGQYGMNINTANNSKRFYSNAVLGTKRLRIRGRNATNIKSKYNTKKQKLVAEADRLRAARNVAAAAAAAEQTQKQAAKNAARTGATMAEMLAKQRRAAATATAKEYNVTRKAQERVAKAEQESIRRAEVAAGIQKQSFMNRIKSIKNPFKRGGSRKTRRSTRSTRRNRRR